MWWRAMFPQPITPARSIRPVVVVTAPPPEPPELRPRRGARPLPRRLTAMPRARGPPGVAPRDGLPAVSRDSPRAAALCGSLGRLSDSPHLAFRATSSAADRAHGEPARQVALHGERERQDGQRDDRGGGRQAAPVDVLER